MGKAEPKHELSPSQHISNLIAQHSDWRGNLLAKLRRLVLEAGPDLAEEWKWDTPVYSHKGSVVAMGVFKDHLKLNFFQGASLQDPDQLFNAGLEAKATRGIDLHEGDEIDESALKELVRAAMAHNASRQKSSKKQPA